MLTRDGSITITFDVIVINYNYFCNCNLIVIESFDEKVIVIVIVIEHYFQKVIVIVIVIDSTGKSNFNYISITFQLHFNFFFKISYDCLQNVTSFPFTK